MLRGESFRIPIYDDASRSTLLAPRRPTSVLFLDLARFHHIIENGQLVGWRYTDSSPSAPFRSHVFLPKEVWFKEPLQSANILLPSDPLPRYTGPNECTAGPQSPSQILWP
jgi:hypothetical protein